MTLGEKLCSLRKISGFSQEELAARMHVSRQAISKWEVGEAMPETDKIIVLSKIFSVSTDFLLLDEMNSQGASPTAPSFGNRLSARTLLLTVTAWNAAGLLLGWGLSNTGVLLEYLPFARMIPGLIMQIIGVALFEILSGCEKKTRRQKQTFYAINVWLLAPLPVVLLVGRSFTMFIGSYGGLLPSLYMAAIYLFSSALVSVFLLFRSIR